MAVPVAVTVAVTVAVAIEAAIEVAVSVDCWCEFTFERGKTFMSCTAAVVIPESCKVTKVVAR